MRVIGTAGHVDHGKTTLVRALTGIDPDRLKEEKARQMTIDLGFAWFTLPNGELIGVVDVPGHRDFIENMLAGVGGIGAVMFVIAADEGVMPQTREHLAIVDLLRIPTGVIALTKIDLVTDTEWLDLVQLDILEVTGKTILDGAPLIPVSARTGQGFDQLQNALVAQLAAVQPSIDLGKPRLWVDRVFSVSGFGTVVTGTLLDGQLTIGQEIEFQPGGLQGRIRGLQTHNQPLDVAQPASRVAVNVAGVDRQAVRRGCLLTLPGAISPSRTIAARIRHLPNAPRPLRHNAEVKFFCGAAESMARVRLLEGDTLLPGAEGWIQIELAEPLPLVKGDRFILRSPSPGETIAGGDVVVTGQASRYRRNRPQVIAGLEALASATPADLIAHQLNVQAAPLSLTQLVESAGLDHVVVAEALQAAVANGVAVQLGDYWIARAALETLVGRLSHVLANFHQAEPLRTGIRPENLRHELGLDADQLGALIAYAVEQRVVSQTSSGALARYGYIVQPNRAQRATIDRLLEAFNSTPHTPPSYKEAEAIAGAQLVEALIEWGDLARIAPDVLFTSAALREIAAETRYILDSEGYVTIKALRDRFNTSRKYAQAALEYFDSLGLTRRQGDNHVLGRTDWSVLGLTERT